MGSATIAGALLARWSAAILALATLALASNALAQEEKPPPARDARLEWSSERTLVLASFSYRDVVDASIRRKLSRGLPTTIVLTATVHHTGAAEPIATTAQSCKITWLVWEEYYLVEVSRPGRSRVHKTLTVEGVLRRCAETQRLPAAAKDQVPAGARLYLRARAQVNPISDEVVKKIKQWISRPRSTGTAGPSDALFSTFTGLFLRRIGQAERELVFTTKPAVPAEPKKKNEENKK